MCGAVHLLGRHIHGLLQLAAGGAHKLGVVAERAQALVCQHLQRRPAAEQRRSVSRERAGQVVARLIRLLARWNKAKNGVE